MLKGRKKIFADTYLSDVRRNQTNAAIKAGYSAKTAAQAASRLMKDPDVKAYIRLEEKRLHDENTAKAEEVIEFLTSVMRGENVDNVALMNDLGFQELTEAAPSARDRIKAAELLGKYYAIFTEKIKNDGDAFVKIINDIPQGGDNKCETG